MSISPVSKNKPSAELFLQTQDKAPYSFSTKDQLMQDDLLPATTQEGSAFSSLDLRKEEITLVHLVEQAEQIQNTLLQMAILEQKELGDLILKKQEEFGKFMAEKRKAAKELSSLHYLEKIASGIFSLFSVAIGAALISTMAPPAVYAGSLFAASGALTLTGLGLETLGFSSSITKPIQMAGLTVGIVSSLAAGYINPGLMTNHLLRAWQSSMAIFSGVATVATSISHSKIEDLEGSLAENNKDKEINQQKLEKVAQELLEATHLAEVAKQAHDILKKEHELKLQYLSNLQQQG